MFEESIRFIGETFYAVLYWGALATAGLAVACAVRGIFKRAILRHRD